MRSDEEGERTHNHYIGADDPGEAQRLMAQRNGGVEELRAILALRPHLPSEARVLELGCGAGDFTYALLTALPDATVLATDRDERLLTAARKALAAEVAANRVTFALADASNLSYPAQSFDLVACRCLLMHQPDPFNVATEMFRVVNVGGLALAIEPDWGARALYPDGDALSELLKLARRAHPFGFPNLLMGRSLFALFRAAGFDEIQTRVSAFVETATDHEAQETDGPITGPARLLEQGRSIIRYAELARDVEIDALIARLAAIPRHPEYFSAGLDVAIVAVKPPLRMSLQEPS